MSFATERTTISTLLSSNWNESTQGKIAWENQPFKVPVGEVFIEFFIANLSGGLMSIGGVKKLERHFGEVQADVYVPQNLGIHIARTRADEIAAIFRRRAIQTSDGDLIQFRTPTIRQLAVNEQRAVNMDDILYRLIVRCSFYRDQYI